VVGWFGSFDAECDGIVGSIVVVGAIVCAVNQSILAILLFAWGSIASRSNFCVGVSAGM